MKIFNIFPTNIWMLDSTGQNRACEQLPAVAGECVTPSDSSLGARKDACQVVATTPWQFEMIQNTGKIIKTTV